MARLAVEFNQGANQVGDDPPALEAINAPRDPPSASDIITVPIVAAVNVLENASKVEPNLAGDLASSEETSRPSPFPKISACKYVASLFFCILVSL